MVTLPEFRALLHYLNTDIDNWLPNSIPTIRTWKLRNTLVYSFGGVRTIRQRFRSALCIEPTAVRLLSVDQLTSGKS
ncbi:hypothetical protein V1520DRAFT_349012 [Lipomyces starkeyi]